MKTSKKFIGFLYDDIIYRDEVEVDEAICEKIGGNYNNIDPSTTSEFEDEWFWVEEVWEDENGFVFNEYVVKDGK